LLFVVVTPAVDIVVGGFGGGGGSVAMVVVAVLTGIIDSNVAAFESIIIVL
jgi:hypothetical protein